MSDDEDYNSEEDADYVPSDGELGSEEENSGDEEDLSVLADDAGTATEKSGKKSKSKKDSKGNLLPRKRKGGIKLEDEVVPTGETYGESEENKELADKLKQEAEEKKTEKEKKKAEDLWASFLSDVKPHTRPAAKATPSSSTTTTQASSSRTSSQPQKSSTAAPNSSSGSGDAKSGSEKITITKVFDFAGEEIKVTKQVDANSKEAKAELKKQEKEQQEQKEQAQQRLQAATSSSSLDTSSSPSLSNILGVKRPAATPGGGLGGILSKIGKKQKMGTLEKSKMDWDSFKKKEGIEEDLKIHNKGKDGYIERMAFLNRADVRQYEIERDLRLSKTGKR